MLNKYLQIKESNKESFVEMKRIVCKESFGKLNELPTM